MTESEALNILTSINESRKAGRIEYTGPLKDRWNRVTEALDVAISVLDKHIPKMVVDYRHTTPDGTMCFSFDCPTCKKEAYGRMYIGGEDFEFCPYCGQKLGWINQILRPEVTSLNY